MTKGAPELDWQPVHFTESGHMRIEISRAHGRHDLLFSMRVGRYDKGKPSSYFRASDVSDAVEALKEAEAWVNANGGQDDGQNQR